MATMDLTVVSREPLDVVEAYSYATLERVQLSNGRRVVFKTLPPDGDWLSRISGGTDRARLLWERGLLNRLESAVDHAVIDVCAVDGRDVVVMRDVSDHLFAARGPVSRSDSRRLLAGLARLHAAGRTEPVQDLCPLAARFDWSAPQVLLGDDGPGPHPSAEWLLAGWEVFGDVAAPDVVEATFAVHADPGLLGRPLAAFEPTVLHGDTKLANLGLGPRGLVAIDWGDMTGFGPPEVEAAWYALMNAMRIGVSAGELFADYEAAADRPLDQTAFDLACVGSMAQLGCRMAGFSVTGRTEDERRRSADELDWWTNRVRAALDRTGLG